MNRRSFMKTASLGVAGKTVFATFPTRPESGNAVSASRVPNAPVIAIEMDLSKARIPFLSWDTEAGDRIRRNLLRGPLKLRIRTNSVWRESDDCDAQRLLHGSNWSYRIRPTPGAQIVWAVTVLPDRMAMDIAIEQEQPGTIEGLELQFPFDPTVTPTTAIPHAWSPDGNAILPLILSAPDFGQVLLQERSGTTLQARLEGSRHARTVDLIVELPPGGAKSAWSLAFTPVVLEALNVSDESLWRKARRGWFNAWQPSSRWGDQNRPFSAPAGILSNNVISDPVSFALPFYADQALWRPQLTPEISAMYQVRRTIEWWLDHRMDSSGEVAGYWNYRNFLDANPGILISAWDYVESSKDYGWLRSRLPQLEALSRFLEGRDIDGDGMVEATQSGNLGGLIQPARSSCWWDALNCGYKDGYSNALIYRAWCCLADLENQLQRTAEANRLIGLAQRLRAAYRNTLFNPETGWLAWWKSQDGRLHDYATPIVNGLAISFGLVGPQEGREILAACGRKCNPSTSRDSIWGCRACCCLFQRPITCILTRWVGRIRQTAKTHSSNT